VTILNFHGVGPITRPMDAGERDCWLETDHFKAVLDLLKGRTDVCVTFDDGNLSDFDISLPALLERGMQATFFVCSGRLNTPSFLRGDHVKELRARGMGIGSHGVAHRSWRRMSSSDLRGELEESRGSLELLCQEPITQAACPFGDYDRHVLSELRRTGYTRVFTSDGGKAETSDWVMARNTIRRTTTLDDLEAILKPASPWKRAAHTMRYAIKSRRW